MRQDSCGCPVDPLCPLLCPSQPLLSETLGDACVHWCAGPPYQFCLLHVLSLCAPPMAGGGRHPFKAFPLICAPAMAFGSSRIIADIFIRVASRLD